MDARVVQLSFTVGLALAVAAPGFAAEHVVTMAGSNYAPARLAAKVGDTVRFVNDDQADHDVFVPTAGFGIDLGAQKPGDSRTMRLGKAGAFDVECVMHPHMVLKITVTP